MFYVIARPYEGPTFLAYAGESESEAEAACSKTASDPTYAVVETYLEKEVLDELPWVLEEAIGLAFEKNDEAEAKRLADILERIAPGFEPSP